MRYITLVYRRCTDICVYELTSEKCCFWSNNSRKPFYISTCLHLIRSVRYHILSGNNGHSRYENKFKLHISDWVIFIHIDIQLLFLIYIKHQRKLIAANYFRVRYVDFRSILVWCCSMISNWAIDMTICHGIYLKSIYKTTNHFLHGHVGVIRKYVAFDCWYQHSDNFQDLSHLIPPSRP